MHACTLSCAQIRHSPLRSTMSLKQGSWAEEMVQPLKAKLTTKNSKGYLTDPVFVLDRQSSGLQGSPWSVVPGLIWQARLPLQAFMWMLASGFMSFLLPMPSALHMHVLNFSVSAMSTLCKCKVFTVCRFYRVIKYFLWGGWFNYILTKKPPPNKGRDLLIFQ